MEHETVKTTLVMAVAHTLPFLAGLPAYLKTRGFQPHVVCSPDEAFQRFCAREECIAHSVRISRSITPFRDLFSVIRLWRTFREVRPAIVNSHMSKAGLVGMMAAWAAGVPVRIYTNHGVAFSSATGWRRSFLKFVETISCRLASDVHTVSPSVRELMIREGCCGPEKIRVLANGSCGIDAKSRFNPDRVAPDLRRRTRLSCGIPPEAPVLGFVGRIAALKGVDDLRRAWEVLSKQYPDLHLLIVGSPDPRNLILPQTDTLLRSDPRVHFTNEVADTVPYFSVMDVQALPSIHEGLPISLLEGAAMRLPIVASRIPGNVDAVEDGVTGTLFPVHDVDALVEAISRYLKDPALRLQHGLAGRRRVLPNFQQEIIWEASYREYVDLLQREGISPPHHAQTPIPVQQRRAA